MPNLEELSVDIEKGILLKTLTKNRDSHLADWVKAEKGWRKVIQRKISALQVDLGANKPVESSRLYLESPPTHHLAEYDEVIEMLHASRNTEYSLTQTQYRNFMKDDWSWKAQWTTSNIGYINLAKGK